MCMIMTVLSICCLVKSLKKDCWEIIFLLTLIEGLNYRHVTVFRKDQQNGICIVSVCRNEHVDVPALISQHLFVRRDF